MKILMVLTSHDKLGNTGRKTGFWLEEFAAPYYTFLDAGAIVTLASPKGGQPPLDPVSDTPEGQTELTRRFKHDPAAQAVLANTSRLADVKASDYDAVFYPGGHGPMWDLAEDPHSIAPIEGRHPRERRRAGHRLHAASPEHSQGRDGEPVADGSAFDGQGHHGCGHVSDRRRDGHGSHRVRRWRRTFWPQVIEGSCRHDQRDDQTDSADATIARVLACDV